MEVHLSFFLTAHLRAVARIGALFWFASFFASRSWMVPWASREVRGLAEKLAVKLWLSSVENKLLATRQDWGLYACGQVRLHWLQSAENYGLVFEMPRGEASFHPKLRHLEAARFSRMGREQIGW
jgi:hypothetical protein